ncbi:MAG TPA: DUF4238 domain-containing protein [Candidatus Micrarchaeia archaeon]|nr:DUF4238 domain-containing protein [Candidatus Micrarchaeia archaeon]
MPIGSHIIPKFYLERFANPPDRKNGQPHIWVYEKGEEPHYRATSVQGYENGYFAFVKPDGCLDESLEERLAELEAACLDTLEVTASQFFDIQSASRRNALAFYASMLFCRAKQRRNRSQDTYAKLHTQFVELSGEDEWIAETTKRYIERHGEPITPQMVKERLLQLAKLMDGTTALRNNFVEDLISAAEILKGVLLKKPWQLWHAPDGTEFVTSDNPLISFIPLGNGRLNSGHGFRKPETIGAFPIGPHVCLAMGASGPESTTITPQLLNELNRTIIELCERYVYSKTRSECIQQLVAEAANTRKYGVNAFLPLGIPVPTAKDFVLHMMRLAPWPFPSWMSEN